MTASSPTVQSTILIVEDNVQLSRLYKKVLENVNLTVVSASTVNDALAIMEQDPPAVLVLDMGLPDGNGERILDYIAQNAVLGTTEIVIVSGNSKYMRKAEQGLLPEKTHFMTKPVPTQELVELVRKLVQR